MHTRSREAVVRLVRQALRTYASTLKCWHTSADFDAIHEETNRLSRTMDALMGEIFMLIGLD